ncbi:MAG: LysE family transporter [Candidatus Altiarchaeota archaeon]
MLLPTNPLLLLSLGFTVGLSGALIPGPLLVYTIKESLVKGKWTGLKVMLGHALVEVAVIILLVAGLATIISSKTLAATISLLGGLMLIYLGARSLSQGGENTNIKMKHSCNLIIGGTFFTAFNPSFPLWWATAGLRLLMEGYAKMGPTGVALVVVGHWIADFGWYIIISHTTARKSKTLFEKGWYKKIRTTLSIMLAAIGVYFLYTVQWSAFIR